MSCKLRAVRAYTEVLPDCGSAVALHASMTVLYRKLCTHLVEATLLDVARLCPLLVKKTVTTSLASIMFK